MSNTKSQTKATETDNANTAINMQEKAKSVTETKPAAASTQPQVETEFSIGIINFSGNVGKTTIKRFLLEPRMQLEGSYSIESINEDGNEGEDDIIIRGEKFEHVQRALVSLDSVIVDIGASNVEETMRFMGKIEGSYDDFDYFLVPVVKSPKQLKDSVTTIHELLKLGVDPERIKIVFSMVNNKEKVEVEFSDLIYALEELVVLYDTKAAVEFTEFYPNFVNLDITLAELLNTSPQDNREKVKEIKRKAKKDGVMSEADQELHDDLLELITTQRYARTAIRNLDEVYLTLFSK